jgi:hypothetical protein
MAANPAMLRFVLQRSENGLNWRALRLFSRNAPKTSSGGSMNISSFFGKVVATFSGYVAVRDFVWSE